MKVCEFANKSDCLKIASDLYGCIPDNNLLFFKDSNLAAVELAIGLSNFEYEVEICNRFSDLPFKPLDSDESVPRIFARCLSAYNNGILHGMWIDANQEPDEIQEAINYMLSWSPMSRTEECVGEAFPKGAEWAIHDYENFEGITISEYESIERVSKLAMLVEEHGEPFGAFLEWYGEDEEEKFEESYVGCYKSKQDFAEEYYDECGLTEKIEKAGLPAYYIDFERIARDMFLDGYSGVDRGHEKFYVFSDY
jgi:antirestriction protein